MTTTAASRPPKVSVVMAVYNGEPYLADAVQSVLGQSYRDYEFIVVNDASTDTTGATLRQLAARDPRLIVIDNEANRGMAGSLNRGLRLARGVYVARHDADDLSGPNRLAEQVAVLDQRAQIGLVSAWVNLIDAAGQPLAIHPYPDITGDSAIQAQLLIANCLCHGSVMFRRALLERVGLYDEQLEGTEDYDLWLRLAEVTQLEKVPLVLYQYRFHAASFSESRRAYQCWQQARTLEKMAVRRYGPTPTAQQSRLVAKAFLLAAEISAQQAHAAAFEDRLAHAIQICPDFFGEPGTFVPLPPMPESLQVLDRVFGRLPPAPVFRRLLRRLRAREHMRAVFARARQGRLSGLEADLWPAVRQDPSWLLNRGVWALAARGLLARRGTRPPAAATTVAKDKQA